MKKILLWCLHRPDRSPSQRYRIEEFIPFLEKNGYKVDYSFLLDEADDKIFYKPGNYFGKLKIVTKSILKRMAELKNAEQYDLVFVQREAFMLGTDYFEKNISKKIPLIFDFDDSIWLQIVSEKNKNLAFLKNADKTSKIISYATMVFAGNNYLADYARQYNRQVEIIPTTIDTQVYQYVNSNKKDGVCIGWSGSFSTIQYFQYAIPALLRIKKKFGDKVNFKIIGDESYYCEELQTQGVPWKAKTEVLDLSEMDIGIMPLPDDEWTKGKCGLKGLQYMALGIPTLMSPVGVNTDIIQNGVNGFLPATEDDWVECISQLVEDKILRQQIGEAGKQTVINCYSSTAWEDKYLKLFKAVTTKD